MGVRVFFGYCPHPVRIYIGGRGDITGYIELHYTNYPTVTERGQAPISRLIVGITELQSKLLKWRRIRDYIGDFFRGFLRGILGFRLHRRSESFDLRGLVACLMECKHLAE